LAPAGREDDDLRIEAIRQTGADFSATSSDPYACGYAVSR
jgi:hypothetical protein